MKKYKILISFLVLFIILSIISLGYYILNKEEIVRLLNKQEMVEDETVSTVLQTEDKKDEAKKVTIGTGIKRPANYAPEVGYVAIYRSDYGENGLNKLVNEIKDEELKNIINEFISSSKIKLENEKDELEEYVKNGNKRVDQIEYNGRYVNYYSVGEYIENSSIQIKTEWECLNGYLSIAMYLSYNYGNEFNGSMTALSDVGERNVGVYNACCATFDLYTGKRLKFSDLFFEGEDYSTEVYELVQSEIGKQRLNKYIKRDFSVIEPDYDNFTINNIYLTKTNRYFSEGVIIPIKHYVTMTPTINLPRNMGDIFNNSLDIKKSFLNYRTYTVQENISGVPFKITKIKYWNDEMGKKINNNIEKYIKYLIDNKYFDEKLEKEKDPDSTKRYEEKNSAVILSFNSDDINFQVYVGFMYPDYTIVIDSKTGDLIEAKIAEMSSESIEKREIFKSVSEELKKL